MTTPADSANTVGSRLALVGVLETLRAVRRDDEVIIPTMGSAREWMKLGPLHPLDFILVPSAMGHGTSIGLGLALARPDRLVIVLSGDGSLLMNLGSLTSIVASRVTNLAIVLFDNGVYEVTGQQPTAGSTAGRAGRPGVDFGAIARACGFEAVHRFRESTEWASSARRILDGEGPTFITLDVEPVVGGVAPTSPGPTHARAREFMQALAVKL
jgi:sulfopyruvate decarboxylase subunit beta